MERVRWQRRRELEFCPMGDRPVTYLPHKLRFRRESNRISNGNEKDVRNVSVDSASVEKEIN